MWFCLEKWVVWMWKEGSEGFFEGVGGCKCWQRRGRSLDLVSRYFKFIHGEFDIQSFVWFKVWLIRGGFFKAMWKIKIPPKVSFLLWRIFLNRIPTKVNLQHRQIQIQDKKLLCMFCKEEVEDLPHLLFKCPISHNI